MLSVRLDTRRSCTVVGGALLHSPKGAASRSNGSLDLSRERRVSCHFFRLGDQASKRVPVWRPVTANTSPGRCYETLGADDARKGARKQAKCSHGFGLRHCVHDCAGVLAAPR
jgi:hypothetical protein